MLFAALASVVIASCYDGDTCTTTTGERVRLACIDTPELVGKRAEPALAKAARDHLRNLVVGKKVGIRRITEDRYERAELLGISPPCFTLLLGLVSCLQFRHRLSCSTVRDLDVSGP